MSRHRSAPSAERIANRGNEQVNALTSGSQHYRTQLTELKGLLQTWLKYRSCFVINKFPFVRFHNRNESFDFRILFRTDVPLWCETRSETCAIVAPFRKRPKTSRSLSLRFTLLMSSDNGIQTSSSTGNLKSGGMTPTTTAFRAFTRMV